MACFDFLKKCKIDEERDQRTPQTNIDREALSNETAFITIHVPSTKSFKLFKYVNPHVTRVTDVTAVTPIRTNFFEGDKAWWSYCCFGLWCRTCAGLVINLKLDKNIRLVSNNRGELNPEISGALYTLRIGYYYSQTQCEDGTRDVGVL